VKHIAELDHKIPRLTFHQWYETLVAMSEDLDRVLSFPQWTKLAGLSERTGRDIIERGDGPKVVQLSPNLSAFESAITANG
jgi:predicted DNA-binding transcriptional regulator AlpA